MQPATAGRAFDPRTWFVHCKATPMDDHLAYFLDLRIRLCGRTEAIAIVDRCIRLIARAEGASAGEFAALQREVESLRAELVRRFGPKPPVSVH